jgi:hypothetical protein
MHNALALSEQMTLDDCEAVIERNLTAFYEVGNALLTIRDSRLYRVTHGTFEDYCRDRWGFTRMRASQLIEAADVVKNVNNCLQAPAKEGQTIELAKVESAQQPAVWQRAIETAPNGKVTAAHVRQVVSEMTAPEKQAAKAIWEEIKTGERETRRVERVEKIAEMSKNISPLVGSQQFPVLYCDPPMPGRLRTIIPRWRLSRYALCQSQTLPLQTRFYFCGQRLRNLRRR